VNGSVTVEVVEFRQEYAPAFEDLNRAWIERDFVLEPADAAVFQDPVGHIVEPGGQIFFALVGGKAAGTCALIPHGPHTYELAKMAVSEDLRGRGIGGQLLAAAIEWTRRAGGERIVLVTNSGLAPALGLYLKYGFERVPLEPGGEYARADVRMVLTLPPP
jgi:GNAT superfamily N-acetyltransferase